MRVAVVGDIGGHVDVFERTLSLAGVDVFERAIPHDLTVVQVGDLVHKGPDSDACVALADDLLRTGRYIQLWGNHDAHYVGGPDVSGRPGFRPISAESAETLRRWADTGAARLAVALDTSELGAVLVTHAGMTVGVWREIGEPAGAAEAATALNLLLGEPERAFRPGALMTGVNDQAAGVTCARTGAELAGPWLDLGMMPFSQIHGHEGTWLWPEGRFHAHCPDRAAAETTLEPDRRRCWVTVGERRLWSIDWVLGKLPPEELDLNPLTLHGKALGQP